jgi:hypothetical protein
LGMLPWKEIGVVLPGPWLPLTRELVQKSKTGLSQSLWLPSLPKSLYLHHVLLPWCHMSTGLQLVGSIPQPVLFGFSAYKTMSQIDLFSPQRTQPQAFHYSNGKLTNRYIIWFQ